MARLLLEKSAENGPPLTQGDLATHLAAAPQSVNRALGRFARGGMVTMNGTGTVAAVDADALKAFLYAGG